MDGRHVEPLLAALGSLALRKIDWVIVGGESGLHAHPMLRDLVVNIRRQCRAQRVPFFFKQWAAHASTRPAGRSTAAPTTSFRSPSIAFSQRAVHDTAIGPEPHLLGAVRDLVALAPTVILAGTKLGRQVDGRRTRCVCAVRQRLSLRPDPRRHEGGPVLSNRDAIEIALGRGALERINVG